MAISIFGLLWLCMLILSLRRSIKYTLYMLIFSFVFQSAWVIRFEGVDLNAALITSLFFIFRAIYSKRGKIVIPQWGKSGLTFVSVLLLVSIISPNIFSGLELYTMTNEGYNFDRIDSKIVRFSFSNLTLGLSVLLYLIDAIMIYNIDFKISWMTFEKIFKNIFYFVFIVGILHVILMILNGSAPILRELFHNEYTIIGNTYFDIYLLPQFRLVRFMSTFYEPSYCGAYLSMTFMFFYLSDLKHKKIYSIISAFSIILCMSSTGFATLCIVFCVYASLNLYKRKILFNISVFILMFAFIVSVLAFSNGIISELLYDFTMGKLNSGSAQLRNIVNEYSLDAFVKTYGLGVGGNAVDSYSLIYSLLAQCGVAGFISYTLFMISIFRRTKISNSEGWNWQIIIIVLSPLVSSVLSCQAINFCVMWMGICIFSLYCSINRFKRSYGEQIYEK